MSSRENYKRFLNAIGTNSVKKRSPSLPIFSSISPKSFSKTFCKASKSFVSLRLTIPLTRNRLLARGTSVPLDPLSAKGMLRKFAIAHKLVCQWRTCTLGLQLSLRSNADPSVIFLPRKVGSKIRENEPFSLSTRQANASLVYPFLPSIVLLKSQCPTKADSTIESPFLPSKSSNFFITENKKQQANLACCFFIFPARCILISYSIDLISSNPNFTSNLRHRIFFTI